MYPLNQLQQSLLSRRLLVYVVICSLLFSIVTTLIQLSLRHRSSMAAVEATFDYIETGYVDSIAATVFALDEEQLRLELKGVLNFPHIAFVEVIEERGGQHFQFQEGDPKASRDIIRSFELTYGLPSKGVASYGVLSVAADLTQIHGQIWKNGIIAFTISVVGLGIVALCIFIIFQHTVTRHLITMSTYTNNLHLNQLDKSFTLERKTPRLWCDDELNQLATALNKLRDRLEQGMREIRIREDELKTSADSLRRYEHIISSTNDLMSFVDHNYIYRSVNDAYLKAHAKERADIVGHSVAQLMGTEYFNNIAKAYLDRCFTGEHVQYQSWIEYTGIGRRYMDVTYHPFQGQREQITGAVVTVHDLTEQRRADEAITAFFDQSMVMLCIADLETGNLVRVNKEVVRITGRSEQDLIDTPFIIMVHPQDRQAAISFMTRLAEGNTLIGQQYRHLTAHKEVRYFEWNAVPDMAHQLIYAMARDITGQKRAEAEREKLQSQLLQAQKMESVGRLAGGVAHDFNNMLSVILGHTELLRDEMDGDKTLKDKVDEIYKAASRSAEFTRQLLAFARKQTIIPKVVDLNQILDGMMTMLRKLIGEEIDLVWLPKTGLWPVKIDPTQVSQVLANLCANARDSMVGVGKVTIETNNAVFDEAYCRANEGYTPGRYVMIAVSDNGSGIEKEDLPKLFEPFFTTKGIGEGTGLGLATVYGIVKQNEGFINVHSEVGEGTTLKLYLPQHADDTLLQPMESAAEKAAEGQETILLVEDEEAIIKMTDMMLKRLGYNTITATSPDEAIRLGESYPHRIDLLLTDVVMPGMSGRDLAEKLLEIHPNLKCLFMSGYTANVIARHGVLEEGIHFIHKPFRHNDLATKIRHVLDGVEAFVEQ